jgi:hypothetical protein
MVRPPLLDLPENGVFSTLSAAFALDEALAVEAHRGNPRPQ